jgi:hypothetical protein
VISTDFSFTIDSYNASDHLVSGSFKGACKHRVDYSDHTGAIHKIKGRFYLKFQ